MRPLHRSSAAERLWTPRRPSPDFSKQVRVALVLVVLLGAALRFYGIWFGLPYPFARPDEEAAVNLALGMQEGDLNPRFFHWPSLTIYLFAVLFAVASTLREALSLGPLGTADYVLLARCLVAVCGSLTILVLFGLARRVADSTTALIAALLLAVALLHVRESHFAMTDVLMTLLLTTSLACLLQAVDESKDEASRGRFLRSVGVAGLLAGLATSTKYSAAAILPTVVAVQGAWLSNAGTSPWAPRAWAPVLSFVAAFGAAFVAATPYALIDSERFVADLRFVFTHLSDGHGIDVGRGWTYHLRRSLPYGAGVAVCMAAIAGMVPFARHLRWHAAVVGAAAVSLYVSVGSGYTVFFRYVLPLVPIVCLLAALGIRSAGRWIGVRSGAPRGLVVGVLTLAVAAPSLVRSVWFDVLLARTASRVLAAAWLAPKLQAHHSLHDSGSIYTRLDLRHVRFHEWAFDAAAGSFGALDGNRPPTPGQPVLAPDWLVLHESPLQLYANTPPGLARLAAARYELVYSVRGTKDAAETAIYDVQDAFFLPMSNMGTVERPGPTIHIYRRRP